MSLKELFGNRKLNAIVVIYFVISSLGLFATTYYMINKLNPDMLNLFDSGFFMTLFILSIIIGEVLFLALYAYGFEYVKKKGKPIKIIFDESLKNIIIFFIFSFAIFSIVDYLSLLSDFDLTFLVFTFIESVGLTGFYFYIIRAYKEINLNFKGNKTSKKKIITKNNKKR